MPKISVLLCFKLSDITAMGGGMLLASDSKQIFAAEIYGNPSFRRMLKETFKYFRNYIPEGRGPIFPQQMICFESDANNIPPHIVVISLNLKS